MKHFTQFFLLFALAIFSSQAFAQSDLQVTAFNISSASGSVPPNFSTVVSYTMKNNGTNIIPAGSAYVRTVSRGILPVVGPDNLVFANALNPGESITLTASSGNYTFGTGAIENVCVSAFLTTVADIDSLNNVFCDQFTVSSSISNDIALVELTTITPSIGELDGFDIDNGTETPPAITMMNLKVANNGDIEYLSADLLIDLVCENSTFQAVGSISNFLPGDTVDMEISNTSIIPAIPSEVGNYTMCVSLVGSDDEPNNDETCFGFSIVDLYIPPPPVGVEETINESYVVAFTNDFISVSNVTSSLNASIVDLNGRVIATEAISTDKKIDLSTLTSGVYFLQTSNTATGEVQMNKFSKF